MDDGDKYMPAEHATDIKSHSPLAATTAPAGHNSTSLELDDDDEDEDDEDEDEDDDASPPISTSHRNRRGTSPDDVAKPPSLKYTLFWDASRLLPSHRPAPHQHTHTTRTAA
jgi:hypothetical protein